jgi:hypothetical protein
MAAPAGRAGRQGGRRPGRGRRDAQVLDTVEMDGTVVIGEGEKDEAPMLYNGEHGRGPARRPRSTSPSTRSTGTRLLAEGRPGSLAVIAGAPAGTMFDPGPCVYMEKLVVGPEAAGVIDLDRPIEENLRRSRRPPAGRRGPHRGDARPRAPREAKREIREAGCAAAADHRRRRGGRAASRPGRSGRRSTCCTASAARRRASSPPARSRRSTARCSAACGRARTRAGRGRRRRLRPRPGADPGRPRLADDCFIACTGITTRQLLRGVTSTGAVPRPSRW